MYLSRLIAPAVLVLGSAVAFLTPAAAQAHEAYFPVAHHQHHHYEVLYRRAACEPWRCFGRFDSRAEAHCAAERLEHDGFRVRIER